MANFGYDDLVIQIDDDAGGTLQDISQWVLEFNGMATESIVEESTTAGDSWVEQLATGLNQGDPINMLLKYDSTTMAAYFLNCIGEQRTVDFDDGYETLTGEILITKKTKIMARGQFTKMRIEGVWTGTITEALS